MSQQEQRPDPLLQAEQQQREEIPVDEKAIGDQEEEEQINAANLEPDSSPTPSPSSSAQVVEDDKLLSILGGDRISSDEDQGGSVHPRCMFRCSFDGRQFTAAGSPVMCGSLPSLSHVGKLISRLPSHARVHCQGDDPRARQQTHEAGLHGGKVSWIVIVACCRWTFVFHSVWFEEGLFLDVCTFITHITHFARCCFF